MTTYRTGALVARSLVRGSRKAVLAAWATGMESFPRPMTNPRSTASTALRWSARALALAAAYFVVAKIGLRYATIGPSISPVWPPTGLAVAALMLLGARYWPAILLGAFVANATTSIPILAAAGIACGNASEAAGD